MSQVSPTVLLTQYSQALVSSLEGQLSDGCRHQLDDLAPKAKLSALEAYKSELSAEQVDKMHRLEAAWIQWDIGLYGLCSDCEEAIECERLEADPSEQRCKACAESYAKIARTEFLLNDA
ncbi:TraR/DksA C4-type zinc finger protein [Paraferrimonas sedimenticola]|uniref:Zinc finger DksA/TraR C4-type domain-containing protein n=1 Tax=Paraferrimonas sedimenticola TaxID=375674 RepID=A0AA37RX12_9GAMM|nr:TraR/DksA C4-type zinc finger protein [Paraferrimonas sedimenticola]GLP96919.1 hypothetical protein GCM10007895_22250 [Paraferrimonas sedimenticola]